MKLYSQNDFASLKEESIEELFGTIKTTINEPQILEDLLITIGCAKSKREAREFIKNGAVSLNGNKVSEATTLIDESFTLYSKFIIVKRGKKNYYLVELTK